MTRDGEWAPSRRPERAGTDPEIVEVHGFTVAEVVSAGVVVHTPQDAVDLVATAAYRGASHLVLHERHLKASFFDLSTGEAGEILQKCVNHRMALVVVGDFDRFESASLRAFIAESNRGRQVAFVPDRNTALARITGATPANGGGGG